MKLFMILLCKGICAPVHDDGTSPCLLKGVHKCTWFMKRLIFLLAGKVKGKHGWKRYASMVKGNQIIDENVW